MPFFWGASAGRRLDPGYIGGIINHKRTALKETKACGEGNLHEATAQPIRSG